MARVRALLSWSTGKDAAWSLHLLRQSGEAEVVGLLTTIDQTRGRVAMHDTRLSLLESQARATGLPLVMVPLPWPCANAEYERRFQTAVAAATREYDVTHIAFGDLFLDEIRAYREGVVSAAGLSPLFPLWGLPTRALAEEMIAGGLRAYITCVDPRSVPASFAGRELDRALLDSLPPGVDSCGEGGEFHTFAFDGPMFSAPLSPIVGEIADRDGYVFADLVEAAPGVEDDDSTFDENGALSRSFLQRRGECCGNRCRNCPYHWESVPEGGKA